MIHEYKTLKDEFEKQILSLDSYIPAYLNKGISGQYLHPLTQTAWDMIEYAYNAGRYANTKTQAVSK